ncbi:hypothetical protein [Methanothrix sp.]|uniref:hypothetical protein n=1 Tax=Methanothrix sp. TaxID=90426 RepID=UPI0032982B41
MHILRPDPAEKEALSQKELGDQTPVKTNPRRHVWRDAAMAGASFLFLRAGRGAQGSNMPVKGKRFFSCPKGLVEAEGA